MHITEGDALSSRSAVQRSWLPQWVEMLDMPVWVTDPLARIQYVNHRAEKLLGKSREACLGEPCHAVVRGTKPSGASLCTPDCAVRLAAEAGERISPIPMRLPRKEGEDQHAKVVVISVTSPDGLARRLVHCAVDERREHRIKKYLTTIVGRNAPVTDFKRSSKPAKLTKREKEILALLAEDETLQAIADRLFISYATVRNHVQHILPKLGVHSILEAVAFYLLAEDE